MSTKTARWAISVLLLVSILVTACGAATEPTAAPPSKGSVALILPGPIGDQGWNTKAYLALQEYEKEGYKTAYVDQVPDVDNEGHLRTFAQQGFTLIVGHGFTFVDPVSKVAPEFPKSNFFITAGLPAEGTELPKNVGYMKYHSEQGAYLAGMLAAYMTKSNVIGYVGAQATPICLADLAGYKMGAREINPDIKVMSVWTGVWDDPAKGKEAALAMVDNGADVLIHDADLTGTGALQAAKERNVYAIGMVDDQSAIAPDLFLTSVMLNITKAIEAQMGLIEAGTFGGVYAPGIKEGVIDIAPLGKAVPADIAKKIMDRRQEIIDGKFEVQAIYEEIP
jgi:basic membrane protein A and related proteins